jgi:hypothetical protein
MDMKQSKDGGKTWTVAFDDLYILKAPWFGIRCARYQKFLLLGLKDR